MLLVILVLAFVPPAIWVVKMTKAILFIFLKIAFVSHVVWPAVGAVAVHLVVGPHAVVLATVGPDVLALTVQFVLGPIALVNSAISPLKDAIAILDSIMVLPIKSRTIRELLRSMAMLHVVLPFSLVRVTTLVSVSAKPICLVIQKLALVNISIGIVEGASTVYLAFLPGTGILALVLPDLGAFAVLLELLFTLIADLFLDVAGVGSVAVVKGVLGDVGGLIILVDIVGLTKGMGHFRILLVVFRLVCHELVNAIV